MWLASFKQPSAVHGEVGKSATSMALRAPAGRFDAAKGESIDTGDGRRAVSSSPGRGPFYGNFHRKKKRAKDRGKRQPAPPQGASDKTSGSISTSMPPEPPAVHGSLPGDDETASLPSLVSKLSPLAASPSAA